MNSQQKKIEQLKEYFKKKDSVILASPSLLFSVLNSGINICMKDRKLYINLLIKTHYEAVDWWNFTKEFYEIAERAKSISEEDKSVEFIKSADK